MAIPGKYNTLNITKIVDFGVYLDGEQLGEILLPMKWVPEGTTPSDSLDVFIYFDSEDRLIATTMKPYAQVGEFALLRAKAVNDVGAFMDWGLDKDLLVPYREQKAKMIQDRFYIVYIYADSQTGRIAGSARLERFFDTEPADFTPGEEVDLLIWAKSDLGYKAIINHQYEGLIYESSVFQELERGQRMKGYVIKVREDGKIDLDLQKPGFEKVDEFSAKILGMLEQNKGFMGVNDKSPAEEIYLLFSVSKKTFKKAIGGLFKQRLITIEENGIRLNKKV
ncbi:MAG: GntR family transcriptional regulator [Lentimicrobiaceae bacterium]|nr:GntR family transcriptional regulator [Lentimicrobiaceae bacterium]MCB9023113.1 GntR family transcriptional regulator [Lentimicrobiaceae bacterium]MCO5264638.1 S1-like domain-containing RNA-binding protein [Lentimicrobium sp.]HPG32998.1 S1-like domain-containing RNA-binding protein [Lentimicrobium sp.]